MKLLEKHLKRKPILILMDIVLQGDMDGIEAAEIIHSRFRYSKIIYVTAYSDEKNIRESTKKLSPMHTLSNL